MFLNARRKKRNPTHSTVSKNNKNKKTSKALAGTAGLQKPSPLPPSPPGLEETFEDSGSISFGRPELLGEAEEQNHLDNSNYSTMKGVSVGLISPDRKERSRSTFDMSAILSRQEASRQQQQKKCTQNPETSNEDDADNADDDASKHNTSWGSNLSPVRSIEEPPTISRRSLSPPTPHSSFRFGSSRSASGRHSSLQASIKQASSMQDALELEAILTREDHEEEDAQDEELLRSTMDLFCNRLSGTNRMLNFVMGAAALLDFLSFISPFLLRREEEKQAAAKNAAGTTQYLYSYLFSLMGEQIEERGPMRTALAFLGDNSDIIGIIFAILWFLHSFGNAARVRNWVLRKRDQERLLVDEDSAEDDQRLKIIDNQHSRSSSSATAVIDWMGGAWGVYVIMILWQLLFLPIGFYTAAYQIITGDAAEGIHRVPECIGDHCVMVSIVTSKYQQSLLYVMCHQAAYYASQRVKEEAKEEYRQRFNRLKRFLLRFAIRHPVEFRRKLQKALRCLRWVRYILPLIGSLNKLKSNMLDLTKKYRQRREAAVLERCFDTLASQKRLDQLSPSEQEGHAPLLIQAAWRARQKRKQLRALKMFQQDPEFIAALKLQKHFKAWLTRSRARLKRKKLELALLQEMELRTLKGRAGPHLTAVQRRRMYQLQNELRVAAKKRRQTQMLVGVCREHVRMLIVYFFYNYRTAHITYISSPLSATRSFARIQGSL